ncbi:MAG: CcmD family protein [Rhodothermales bacterium]|nr:CcmD family protein [Rhodothermales bacterium]
MEQDTLAQATAYDSVWANTNIPVMEPSGIQAVMLSDDKILVVLGVVLIIWFGIVFFLYRTDRKLANLERTVE